MRKRAVAFLAAVLVAAAAGADDGAALREAARKGDLPAVKALLDRGVQADAQGRHGVTPLMLAASEGHLEVARLLVDRGADVNASERFFGSSVLGQAARTRRVEIVRWLLEKGSTDADEALGFALQAGDVPLARQAIASGHLEPLGLLAYRKMAEAKESKATPEMKALLAAATVTRPARKPFTGDPKRLAAYAGR
jgi:hypothetical protein